MLKYNSRRVGLIEGLEVIGGIIVITIDVFVVTFVPKITRNLRAL